jgi:hypothetical protein
MPESIVRDNGSDPSINIRSPRYFLARTVGVCWHCSASTPLVALALPPGHEALELDDDALDDNALAYGTLADGTPADETTADEAPANAISQNTWSVATHHAFLFYVEYLSDAVRHRLNALTPCYRFDHSEAAAGSYWANHCESCGSLLDDHELFCEPDGAFLPTSEANAGLIHLLPIDEGFEAAAAGYAYEPQFFDFLSKG